MKRKFIIGGNHVLFAFFVMVIVALIWYLNRPPVFIRYDGYQPEMVIKLLNESTTQDSVRQVVQTAKTFYNPSVDYWPEPASIYEADTFWIVQFRLKKKVFLWRGKEHLQEVEPDTLGIRVEKSNMSCSLRPSQ
jgi:hypothetical protein